MRWPPACSPCGWAEKTGCHHEAHPDDGRIEALQRAVRLLVSLPRMKASFLPGHCEVAGRLAQRLGFDERFMAAIAQLYARWDGKGIPSVRGDAIARSTQVIALAHDMVATHRSGGASACLYNVLGFPAGVVPVTRVREVECDARPETRDAVQRVARDVDRGSAGLPVGVQVVARPWMEHIAQAVMAQVERSVAPLGLPVIP